MKIYNPNPKKEVKQWCLRLINAEAAIKISILNVISGNEKVFLCAVDVKTGDVICNLINFHIDGGVVLQSNASTRLKTANYNPHQHNNSWDENGSIVID